jgi:hypothetical protein
MEKDDFDKVPVIEPKSKKTRAYRKQLPGHSCHFCENYYKETGTSNSSSRHRGYKRPPTPENFWELDFPSDEECRRRGYIHEEEYKLPPLETNKYYKSETQWRLEKREKMDSVRCLQKTDKEK